MLAKCISRALLSSLSTMAVVFFPQMSKAADLPATPVFAAVGVNWDGFYAGVHGGIAEGWASWSNPTGYFTRPPSDVSGQGPQEGLFGGLQLGYNRQLGALVLGLEGDVSGGKLDGNTSCGATVGFGGTHDPCHASTNVMASITGRIGYAAGRALFYAKAGGAFANEQYDVINPVFAPLTPAQQSAGRYGWTLGAGLEYALGGNWSAKAEYDYYNFGTRTVSFAIPLFPGFSSFLINRDQHLAKFGLNYRFAGEGADLSAPAPAFVSDLTGEFGGRVGFSNGRFHKNLFDPFNQAQLNSRLTWVSQTGISLESFARADHISGVFAKGYVGGIDLFGSHMNDEDFPPAEVPYSNTISSTKNGRDFYASADVGYSFLRGDGWKLGGFLGYHYYAQRMNAFGCNQISGGVVCAPPGNAPANALTLSETEHWQAARVGIGGDIFLTDRLKWQAEAVWLPYMSFNGKDNHWLRANINPLNERGHGFNGYQFESILSYALTERVDVGIGGRYWQFFAQHGSTNFPGSPPSPERFTSSRYGAFVQASYRFGDVPAPVVAKY